MCSVTSVTSVYHISNNRVFEKVKILRMETFIEMDVPRILYQTWKTKIIPEKFVSNQLKWFNVINYDPKKKTENSDNSDWSYVLLDDKDLRNLVKTNFPEYLKAYDSFSKNIERVDFARLVMMYLGGVYADLDTYPVKSIEDWVSKGKIILGREPLEHAKDLYGGRDIVLCNAFMISPPKQKIWIDMMNYIVENYEANYKPVYNTGPMAMTLFMEKNPDLFTPEAGVVITDPCVFFPMLGNGTFSHRCVDSSGKLTPLTYVVHEWENTWVVPWYKDREWLNKRYWFWALVSLFTVLWLRSHNSKN